LIASMVKAKFHYAVQLASRRRPARDQILLRYAACDQLASWSQTC